MLFFFTFGVEVHWNYPSALWTVCRGGTSLQGVECRGAVASRAALVSAVCRASGTAGAVSGVNQFSARAMTSGLPLRSVPPDFLRVVPCQPLYPSCVL